MKNHFVLDILHAMILVERQREWEKEWKDGAELVLR